MPSNVFIPKDLDPLTLTRSDRDCPVHILNSSTMGTQWTVHYWEKNCSLTKPVQKTILKVLDRINKQMNLWERTSEISRYNQTTAPIWVSISEEFLYVIKQALEIAQKTSGAFNPCLADTVNRLGFGPSPLNANAETALLESRNDLSPNSWQDIAVDEKNGRVFQPGGCRLDLNAIAKGFAVDQIFHQLQDLNIPGFLVEIGGEFRGLGCKPDGQPWWCQLETPGVTANEDAASIVATSSVGLATSGNYRRSRTYGDTTFGHIIDPAQLLLRDKTLTNVSVISDTCMVADAFATALFVMGLDEGLQFANKHNIPARFLVSQKKDSFTEHFSEALTGMLE